MENNNWLSILAVLAVVAIVAVFGMVSMTGYVTKVQDKTPAVCSLWEEKCNIAICAIQPCRMGDVWCATACQCLPEGTDCPSAETNCQQCCALSFACNKQFCKNSPETCMKTESIQTCMDKCGVGGGNSGNCFEGTGCTTKECCPGYTGIGCLLNVCEGLNEHYCQPNCAIEIPIDVITR